MQTFSVQVARRGLATLPRELRRAHGIEPGQRLTLVDLDGVFVLSPSHSRWTRWPIAWPRN